MGTTVRDQKQKIVGNYVIPPDGEGDELPMYFINWEEAVEFCRRLTERERAEGRIGRKQSYRLPTEAEWEWAARAGTATAFHSGNDEAALNKTGWYRGNSNGKPHPVGGKLPNAWGLFDMHGNVRELCSDIWGDYPAEEVRDPIGPGAGQARVMRGGSFTDRWDLCRSAMRLAISLTGRGASVGFRVVLDVE